MNSLILGDNLEVLKRLNSESVDLIYLDPPFFSNRNYEVIWGDAGEIRSFQDRWLGGIPHYIDWLKDRVCEMHRILKPTGSIFLHCDWHADAYIRVEILDKVFGLNNFKNHVIWVRSTNPKGSQFASDKLSTFTDSIFIYAKTNAFKINANVIRGRLSSEELDKKYDRKDEKGRYTDGPIIRGQSMGARPNLVYEYKGYTPEIWGWRLEKAKLIEIDKKGDLGWSSTGKPYRKIRPEDDKGEVIGNFWNDISLINSQSKERIGYPTQKPEKLLERIIEMASNEGDVVLDPFAGGGTTVAVADRLKRQWIGIDQSVQAVKVTEMRLRQQSDLFSQPFETQLLKYDYETLRFSDAFEFEQFIITQYGGTPNVKQRGDFGIDGKASDNTPIQVKRSDGIGRNVVDNFHAAILRFDKRLYEKNKLEERPVGYLIAFSFGKGAYEEIARLKNVENISIKLVKVSEIVPMAERPKLQVTHTIVSTDKKGFHNVQFIATAQSDCEIQFYSWDMDYKPDLRFRPSILLDKKGEQSLTLKTGVHTIAVKVVNDNGLEAIEIIRLTV